MGNTEASLSEVAAHFRSARRLLLTTHVNPDGDGLGSGLGLASGLASFGKEAIMSVTSLPAHLAFLPGSSSLRTNDTNTEPYDCLVALDCATWDRLGHMVGDRHLYGIVVNIDHHISNEHFGDCNFVVPEAAATGVLAYRLLQELGVPINAPIATALYTAIAADTGFFRYSNTNAEVFEIATALVRAGASPYAVHHALHENHPPSYLRMLREALHTLEYHADGRIGLLVVTPEVMERVGGGSEDVEGLVDLPRTVAGVEVAVLLRPLDKRPGFKISLRSKHKVDVAKVAEVFGGGGHSRAAGCHIEAPLEEVRAQLVEAITAQVKEAAE